MCLFTSYILAHLLVLLASAMSAHPQNRPSLRILHGDRAKRLWTVGEEQNFLQWGCQRISARREKEKERVNPAFSINKSGFSKDTLFPPLTPLPPHPPHVCWLPSLLDGHLQLIWSPFCNCFLAKLTLCRKNDNTVRMLSKLPGEINLFTGLCIMWLN